MAVPMRMLVKTGVEVTQLGLGEGVLRTFGRERCNGTAMPGTAAPYPGLRDFCDNGEWRTYE